MATTLYHNGRFPPNNIDWSKLLPLIGPSHAAIAGYEGILRGIPNSNILLSPLTTQEAVLSSRIEGTQATVGEVLEFEAEADLFEEDTPKTIDIQEVLNYRAALREGESLLDEMPLCQRLFKRMHKVLMQGVRGRNSNPGEYRETPNWIGPAGCTIEDARFIPCSADHLQAALGMWEQYIHAPSPDPLVQLAIIHAEFEAIHPFLDGNGRLGRLIVPLFLTSKKILARPNFYLSGYLESHRDEYYERLLAVSRDDDWTGWCGFFLQAIIAQAEENRKKAEAILRLYSDQKNWIVELTHSQYAIHALDSLFQKPIFRSADFVADANIPKQTAMRILRELREAQFLSEIMPARGRRSAILCFRELVNIAEGNDVF